MPFDSGLHVIWTTYNSWPVDDPRGCWPELLHFYERLTQDAQALAMSKPLPPRCLTTGATADGLVLRVGEAKGVGEHTTELTALRGDRVVAGLHIEAHSVGAHRVQILLCPTPTEHAQQIGRIKSKTASQLLRSPERRGQQRIWARGYWFAHLLGEEAVREAADFISRSALSGDG